MSAEARLREAVGVLSELEAPLTRAKALLDRLGRDLEEESSEDVIVTWNGAPHRRGRCEGDPRCLSCERSGYHLLPCSSPPPSPSATDAFIATINEEQMRAAISTSILPLTLEQVGQLLALVADTRVRLGLSAITITPPTEQGA